MTIGRNPHWGHGHCGGVGMRSVTQPYVGREAASRALIDLVADVAWAERVHLGGARRHRMRDEAMALLPKVERGDREATLRAIELVSAAGDGTR